MPDSKRTYNPLNRLELGKSVERALLNQELVPLKTFAVSRSTKFEGAGLYALYYGGDLAYYAPIAPPQCPIGNMPIYVGRALPKGVRRGAAGLDGATKDTVLFDRLREHANSIRAVERYAAQTENHNLRLSDFFCRYLIVDDIWIPLGEALLIGHYRPLWNVQVDGFGNHEAGSGRRDQARSSWDTLHPGRGWALRHEAKRTKLEIIRGIEERLRRITQPNLDEIPSPDEELDQALSDGEDQE